MQDLPSDSAGARSIFDLVSNDPDASLIDRSSIGEDELRQIGELMNALGELRAAERRLSEAAQRYMRLNETDMRALHFLIVMGYRGELVTPGQLAQHLGISTASTTKLLDRLERGAHIVRAPHPTDRRALTVSITPETHRAARESVGRQQARRFHAAARLDAAEREIVIRFLREMASDLETPDGASAD